jgi:RNA polymerase sigma factor (sigma-70 family)
LDDFLAEFSQPLFRYLLRMTRDHELAADLAQETLLRAWKRRRSLRDQRARRVWVLRIGTNLYRDHLRRRDRDHVHGVQWDRQASGEPSPASQALQKESLSQLAAAIDQLPERQRQVIYLRVVEQLDPREIAKVIGMSAGAVRSSLSVARKRLRDQLPQLAQPDDRPEKKVMRTTNENRVQPTASRRQVALSLPTVHENVTMVMVFPTTIDDRAGQPANR